MVEHIVVDELESKPPKRGPARTWTISAAWLPIAGVFGAMCTLAVVSMARSGPSGWWLEMGSTHGLAGLLQRPLAPSDGPRAEAAAAAAAATGGPCPHQQQQARLAAQAGAELAVAGGSNQQQRQQLLGAPADASAWAERLRVPWGPLLTREEAARGLTFYGSGERLQAVAAKLLAGRPIKAFTLGASVTRGIGSSRPELCYAQRFFQFLNSSFPHRDHEFFNRGIGGTSSGVYAVCAEQMVHEDADLVVLEFTINDPKDVPYTTAERRGYEQLIRKLMALPGRPAILQLHHWGWWHAVGDGVEDGGLFYYPAGEAQLGLFAQYYDTPSLSVRGAMWRLMQGRVPGFNPDRQRYGDGGYSPTNVFIPAAEPGHQKDYWYRDRTHPGDEGHGTLAELLASAVSRAVLEVLYPQPNVQLASDVAPARAAAALGADGLPPPMVPGNLAAPTSLCAMQEAFKGVVVAAEGFAYRAEKPGGPSFVEQKWGWTGMEPGAWAEMEFDTATGFQEHNSTKVSTAEVSLSFLRSYEGMGVAEVACVSGCTCGPAELDGTWEKRVSLQAILQFWVTRHPRCRVRVTISERPGAVPQDGHKVSLTAVMVSHWALRLNKYDEQVERVAELLT